MGNITKKYPPSFKAKVFLEVIREEKTSPAILDSNTINCLFQVKIESFLLQ